jgi:predicted LPLAT superfamily acyltransferase
VTEAHKGWREVPEKGTTFGIRFVIVLSRMLGRRLARAFVSFLAFYYCLFGAQVRQYSQDYLRRLGASATFWNAYRHIRTFAHTLLDRLYFVQDRFDAFAIHSHGHEHLLRLTEAGKGAILLGAHLGSFEAMRAQSQARKMSLVVIGDFTNAQRMNRVLKKINPEINTRFMQIVPGSVEFALKIGEAIERGELVAILGDRVGHGKSITVDFLGGKASFPTGPYLLAATLKCPIYLTFSLASAPNRYDLYCEPFAESIDLPRSRRDQALRAYVQRYAHRLESFCRLSPYNWFNFFSFWQATGDDSPPKLHGVAQPDA